MVRKPYNRTQAMTKATKTIIAEDGDELYFRTRMFPTISLGEQQEKESKYVIRQSFYDDIARKYDIPRQALNYRFNSYNIEILRSLAVFGDHEYIIDNLRAELKGTF